MLARSDIGHGLGRIVLRAWIPVKKLAEAIKTDENTIKNTLAEQHPPVLESWSPSQAEALVKQLGDWAGVNSQP